MQEVQFTFSTGVHSRAFRADPESEHWVNQAADVATELRILMATLMQPSDDPNYALYYLHPVEGYWTHRERSFIHLKGQHDLYGRYARMDLTNPQYRLQVWTMERRLVCRWQPEVIQQIHSALGHQKPQPSPWQLWGVS